MYKGLAPEGLSVSLWDAFHASVTWDDICIDNSKSGLYAGMSYLSIMLI